MAEKLLEVKNLRTEFKRDKTWVTAVNNVSFSIQPGEILGLVGESGCGKSVTSLSIMKLLARNSKISNGEILLNGKDLLKEDKKGMRKIRGREVAMIFQEPMNSLNPCMRIEKQLTEAILLHNNFSKEEAHNRAFEVLKSVGIPEPDMTLKSYPHQLSGGMCQRVMIAMAMSCEPELLIADVCRPNCRRSACAGTFCRSETSIYTGADWFCTETWKWCGISSVHSGKRTGSVRNAERM